MICQNLKTRISGIICLVLGVAFVIVGLYYYHMQYLCYEYTPLQIKQAVTGYGRAEKGQVQQMVKMLLNLNAVPKPDDAADALAVAICHAHSAKINEELGVNRL